MKTYRTHVFGAFCLGGFERHRSFHVGGILRCAEDHTGISSRGFRSSTSYPERTGKLRSRIIMAGRKRSSESIASACVPSRATESFTGWRDSSPYCLSTVWAWATSSGLRPSMRSPAWAMMFSNISTSSRTKTLAPHMDFYQTTIKMAMGQRRLRGKLWHSRQRRSTSSPAEGRSLTRSTLITAKDGPK